MKKSKKHPGGIPAGTSERNYTRIYGSGGTPFIISLEVFEDIRKFTMKCLKDSLREAVGDCDGIAV